MSTEPKIVFALSHCGQLPRENAGDATIGFSLSVTKAWISEKETTNVDLFQQARAAIAGDPDMAGYVDAQMEIVDVDPDVVEMQVASGAGVKLQLTRRLRHNRVPPRGLPRPLDGKYRLTYDLEDPCFHLHVTGNGLLTIRWHPQVLSQAHTHAISDCRTDGFLSLSGLLLLAPESPVDLTARCARATELLKKTYGIMSCNDPRQEVLRQIGGFLREGGIDIDKL